MNKQKYFVVNPWRKGMRVGETFETDNLHPALANHVRPIPDDKEEELKEEEPKQDKQAKQAKK